jgi:hypothetical protein
MKTNLRSLFIVLALFGAVHQAAAQGSAFTYQGQLALNGIPANGIYDFKFDTWNASTGGSVLGGPVTNALVGVTNGLFTTIIDFGAGVFTGGSNWLHIQVRTNGSGAFSSLLPRQQLTPTPYAIFAETANAAGLSGTIPTGDLSGVSGTGLTGVALLAGGNTFSGNQTIDGMLDVSNGVGANTTFNDVIIGPGGYYPGEQHSINFNDGSAPIGSLIMGYNGTDGYFSIGNLYHDVYQSGTKAFTVFGDGDVSIGTTAAPQQYLSVHGGVNIDQANDNGGFINNGNTNGYGLTFGGNSGEGIASQRQATGGNQYGLDFYTDFTRRMSISQSGFVGIGRSSPLVGDDWLDVYAPVTNNYGGMYVETAGTGLPFYGYSQNGVISAYTAVDGLGANKWFLYNGGDYLTFTTGGSLGVNTFSPSQALEVNGEYLMVDGLGGVDCYMGDDGFGNDVQIGSLTSGVTAVACYNATDNAYMHLYCSSITIEGGADLAEPFKLTAGASDVPQGAVVVIDDQNPGHLKMSDQGYDTRVAGVVSGANGINPGIQMQQQGILEGGKNVALTGRVYVQADTSNGAIKPGDLLTTSSIPGHAMKVTDHARAAGAILGKAMTGLSEGKGMVLVLVTLQ